MKFSRLINSKLMEKILYLILIGGGIIFITLPFCLKWYLEFSDIFTTPTYVKILVILYSSGILALGIVHFTIKLLKNVNQNKPFSQDNVKLLKYISIFCLIIAVIYLISIPIIKSVFTIILFMIFTIMGFMCNVLSDLFHKAIEYKEENELTI
ncbi:MAG: DUF2975 domain-containing protein [Clostridia bacterium]|nr:DUF2975 domain-containing protein [Clostridia bacterium]